MGMLSSIELPHWLMIGGAILIAMGSLGLAFSRNKEIALILNHHLNHAQRCRRCQGCLILQATRAADDPCRRAVRYFNWEVVRDQPLVGAWAALQWQASLGWKDAEVGLRHRMVIPIRWGFSMR